MKPDLIERLRGVELSVQEPLFGGPMCAEAADEIESLRSRLVEATELLREVDWRVTIKPSLGQRISDYLDRIDAHLSRNG